MVIDSMVGVNVFLPLDVDVWENILWYLRKYTKHKNHVVAMGATFVIDQNTNDMSCQHSNRLYHYPL